MNFKFLWLLCLIIWIWILESKIFKIRLQQSCKDCLSSWESLKWDYSQAPRTDYHVGNFQSEITAKIKGLISELGFFKVWLQPRSIDWLLSWESSKWYYSQDQRTDYQVGNLQSDITAKIHRLTTKLEFSQAYDGKPEVYLGKY